jgi:hypothetical protein
MGFMPRAGPAATMWPFTPNPTAPTGSAASTSPDDIEHRLHRAMALFLREHIIKTKKPYYISSSANAFHQYQKRYKYLKSESRYFIIE